MKQEIRLIRLKGEMLATHVKKNMSWNYRLMVEKDGDDVWFELHEVYYDKRGIPEAYSESASFVVGNDMDDILFVINEAKSAMNRPILWKGDRFPEEFDYDKWWRSKGGVQSSWLAQM